MTSCLETIWPSSNFVGVGYLQGVRQLAPNEEAVTSTDQRFFENVTAATERNMDNDFFFVKTSPTKAHSAAAKSTAI